MTNTLAIAQRELKTYFVSPIAYVVATLFLVMAGYLFSAILYSTQEATLRYLLGNVSVIFLFITPALSMRLLAEEQRSGTIELLLTNPVRDVELVLGKYLASVLMLLATLAPTLYYPLVLSLYGSPDQGPLLSGYLGVALLGAAFLAVGLLASSLTQNQIVAAVLTFGVLLLLWLSDALTGIVRGPVGDLARYLSVNGHFNDFPRGVISTTDLIYFLSIIAACLFLTVVALQTRRWR
ncbi:MAG: ABC transporter permease subunit [Chloroflexi bacterium]|nr:ABC transporter permease subunit [Chloroflexota bacterium]